MSDQEVYKQAMQGYTAAIIEEQANFQRARVAGDVAAQVAASQGIASLRAQANEYQKLAVEHAQSMQQPQGNKWGLSEREVEIAKNSFGEIKRGGHMVDLSEDEKCELYARNRNKLHRMRADGTYRHTTEQTG
jgi:hypothetical protein